MSKSIRVSDELADSAEAAAAVSHRSPQQIEHWAQIGRVLEPALSFQTESAIKRVGRPELDALLDEIGSSEATARTQAIIRRTSGAIASTES